MYIFTRDIKSAVENTAKKGEEEKEDEHVEEN